MRLMRLPRLPLDHSAAHDNPPAKLAGRRPIAIAALTRETLLDYEDGIYTQQLKIQNLLCFQGVVFG